ncbi:biotin transporter BioY [Devosia sp. FJ2-5-3]|jgi:biotin transport system substrate-specific component|uniref:biotin transporter BioY n=1 Tax=Devosia sp. FJ2-5-3 TaxID=2976680 RepID=UPI0023D7F4E0|nr:biotin transporter BioY [Devosia sp. FJ2-5-3]WEJ57993.1 biotin transporter BioY [Devosia sp. FJ2-5-3]
MSTRSLVLIALFTAIIVVLGLIPPIMVGFFPVPIQAQNLGVMLAGVVLGARGGAFSVLLLLVLVAIGLPVLSGGRGGLAVFMSPTAGYLVGFLPAAFVTGWLSSKAAKAMAGGGKLFAGFFLAAAIGVVIDHAFGIAWLAFAAGLSLFDAVIGNLIFVPGDLIKAAIAAYVGLLLSTNLGARGRLD